MMTLDVWYHNAALVASSESHEEEAAPCSQRLAVAVFVLRCMSLTLLCVSYASSATACDASSQYKEETHTCF